MAFADLGVKDAREEQVKPLSKSKIRYLARTMRRRLNSRCKGLLEVGLLGDEQDETEFWDDNLTTSDLSLEEVENESEEEDDGWTSDDGRGSADNVDGFTLEEMDSLAIKKVQYLHRTVKDFLEQPEIWDRIVAGAGERFHPHTALYASYLLQLKSLDPDTMTKAEFWDTLTWTIEYAASTEKNISKSEYIEYIDEIDRAARQLCNKELSSRGTFTDAQTIKFMNNRKTNMLDLDDENLPLPSELSVSRWLDAHWTTTVPSKRRQRNTTFLSVAVWCGLTSYLAVKLAKKDSEAPAHPLLFSAVMDYDLFHRMRYFDRPHCVQANPTYDVVRLLLDNGASPDVTSPSSASTFARKYVTPWKIVWKKHLYENTGSWEGIYELFVSHGAGNASQDGVVKKKERKAQQKHTDPKAEKWTHKFGIDMLKSLRKEP